MLPNTCPFCEHSNPAESKFCSECGGCLYLLPCPNCGALIDVTTSICYQCQSQMPEQQSGTRNASLLIAEITDRDTRHFPPPIAEGSRLGALYPSLPVADVAKPVPRRGVPMVAGTAFLAVMALLGYHNYRQRSPVDAPQPAAANSSRGVIAGAAAVRRDEPAADTTSAKAGAPALSAVASEQRAGNPAVQSQAVNDHAVRNAGESSGCTEAVAALGLCATNPVPNKNTEADADSIVAAIARAQAPGAGEARRAEPPRQDTCTEVVTALGLCAPTPAVTHTQRRN